MHTLVDKGYLITRFYLHIILVAVVFLVVGQGTMLQAQSVSDPLPSWNECANKQAILDFVHDTTTANSPDYVAPPERIAAFDQDGTLWVEQPIYTEATFSIDRIRAMASDHPDWKTNEPFASILSGDKAKMDKFAIADIETIVSVTHSGMTVEQFRDIVKTWLAGATHPRFKRPYTQLIYQPMLEAMKYLRDSGYQTYIVTGGGQDFVRVFSEPTYGVGPEHVIGTAETTKYMYAADGRPELMKLPKPFLINDKGGKPIGIHLVIGRRPYAAFGNSTGDKEMLEYTQAGNSKRLMMLVHHDDALREYAYGPESKIGTFSDALMEEAQKRGWMVISMKNDWKTIFK
jgi:phosphoserine phosphatase